jgi:type IV pilus modification protein PilV
MSFGISVTVSSMNIPRSTSSSRQAGMSLIEVLMAVLLVSIGLLGAAGMHVRAIQYTSDTERRQMASMVASELMETMRGDTLTLLQGNGVPKTDLGGRHGRRLQAAGRDTRQAAGLLGRARQTAHARPGR